MTGIYGTRGTPTYFLEEFENKVRSVLPSTAVIYDEGLSYESAVKLIRDQNNYNNNAIDPLPLFAYKRTVLKPIRDRLFGLRAENVRVCGLDQNGQLALYKLGFAEFEILFAYFTKDIELQERFETSYANDININSTEELLVRMPEIGDLSYKLKWEELQDFTIEESEANYFKSLIGSVKVRGFFFNYLRPAKRIDTINATFIGSANLSVDGQDEQFSTHTIEGEE